MDESDLISLESSLSSDLYLQDWLSLCVVDSAFAHLQDYATCCGLVQVDDYFGNNTDWAGDACAFSSVQSCSMILRISNVIQFKNHKIACSFPFIPPDHKQLRLGDSNFVIEHYRSGNHHYL